MKLLLNRQPTLNGATIGALYVDGRFECHTLEDAVREVIGKPVESWKQFGKTAIPRGIYALQITMSNRFKRELPLLMNVQGFEGVRIHPGNTAEDTEGCILVGAEKTMNTVLKSQIAFAALFPKLQAGIKAGPVLIEIR